MENYLNKDYINAQQAANLAGVNYATIIAAIQTGELTALELGRGYKTTKEWVNAWVGSKVVRAAKQGEK